jgi:homoserine dehydrogenase
VKTVRIILCGCGGVGRSFLQLLADRGQMIETRYGFKPVLESAADLNGAALADSETGLPVRELVDFLNKGNEIQHFPVYGKAGMTGMDLIALGNADVMVESTPTDLKDGGAAKAHVFGAVDRQMEVVSANKGPFVLFYEDLFKKAKARGVGLHISAATAAALPTLDVGLTCLAGTHVLSAEGILNGTTNYILTRMYEEKTAYDVALKAAQKLGIAETDPSYDVEGKDSANKILLIANRVFGQCLGLDDVSVTGITSVTPADIEDARKNDQIIKLIGEIRVKEDAFELSVRPKALDQHHPLASVNGSEKAICYDTDTMGNITVMGGKSSPVGAAAAMLKDMINAFTAPQFRHN